ncbi:MAG: class I SAM-dependent methyltransferase [Pirellulaceae bacterium]|nr:class I SAM-dependent methyltransferase [Pirellulaceae bacterium]
MSSAAVPEVPETFTSYDEVQYPSHAYEATHPDNMYTLGKLFHVTPGLPDESSILELGCASGGNVIPLALQMPRSRVIGVDLSSKQIAEGQATINALGLKNITLRADDFCNIDESYGQFEYIICHGVFSWVPPHAQRRILEVCRDRLTPNGIAYISYNANPGWFMRGMIRQMMLYHIKDLKDTTPRVQQARAFLSFLVTSTEGQETPYAKFLKQELDMLSKHSDSYLFHEHLEENNHPMFFFEFMNLARQFDLQFLSESNLPSMIASNLSPKAAEALTALTTDVYQRSQYTDFVTNRMFRQNLLCLKDIKVNRHITESSVDGARFSGRFQPEDATRDGDVSPKVEINFKCPNGRGIKTAHPVLKALMFTLNEAWPTSLPLAEIVKRIEKRLSETLVVGEQEPFAIPKICLSQLMQMMVRGDVETRFVPDRFVEQISNKPTVSPYTRLQASREALVTTNRHGTTQLDPLTRLILPFFDGTRDRMQLAECMGKLASEGKIKINVQGGTAPADMSTVHAAAIDKIILQLKRLALLVN